jgi:hypothetical protein
MRLVDDQTLRVPPAFVKRSEAVAASLPWVG